MTVDAGNNEKMLKARTDVDSYEVTEYLFQSDAVPDAAAVDIPDERYGETVNPFAVPMPHLDVTLAKLKQFCQDTLVEYEHPREVEFVDKHPRTTTGKVQRFELRECETQQEAAE